MLLDKSIKLILNGELESLEFKKTTGDRTEAAKTVTVELGCIEPPTFPEIEELVIEDDKPEPRKKIRTAITQSTNSINPKREFFYEPFRDKY